jgi:hypothetical protein
MARGDHYRAARGVARPLYTTQLTSSLVIASDEPLHLNKDAATSAAVGTMLAAPTAEDLGLAVTTLQDAIGLVSGVPFLPAMLLVSALAAELYHRPRDIRRQLDFARAFLSNALVAKMAMFMDDDPTGHVVFDARFVHALQRVLIVHAAEDPTPPRMLDEGEAEQVLGALLALGAGLPAAVPPDHDLENPDWRGWTSFITQSSGWYGDPYVVDAVARSYTMFSEIPSSAALQRHAARSEIDERMIESYSLGLAEQLAGGLAAVVVTKALTPDMPPEERPGLGPDFLGDAAVAAHADAVISLLSATRGELRDDLLRAGDTPEKIAWDHSALEAHPLLRLPNGQMELMSPKALVAWMTRGMHYRLLDAAGRGLDGKAKEKARGLFLTYTGALGQEYVRRVVNASLATAQRAGAVRMLPEIEYCVGDRRKDSPDVGIDAGPDVVLFEVYSGRMGIPARTGASEEALADFVNRATGEKLVELADRTRELLSGDLVYEGVDLAIVRRIFPVVVLAGEPLIQQPLLWGHLRSAFPRAWIRDGRVQRPVLLDLDDLEALLTLAEAGHHLPDLLAEFLASEFSELPPRNWATRHHDIDRRPTYVNDQYRAAVASVRQVMYPSDGAPEDSQT